ncbi:MULTISPECIES: SGNH/GDSL hydrolase family protein [unclassified Polaromonas]|uniref:SGNH/GDSL hydrolase family protein n=1 Tax=unclassified Polaromonas TaxID=2638319 RepID=UPI000F0978F1|nr:MULTISPECIES: SGNH/GDSL hydrolase family protein [unclassified Polaromonas]AYQ30016.1 SGNH/GDSL hydrolase family protein [Polaromonas sp. SP1]QGJ18870.1 SGNH/GDSL hydrolase family protein [Polaromonas sp. Pch-P]
MNTFFAPKLRALQAVLSFALLAGGALSPAQAADAGVWTPSWTASPQPIWSSDFVLPLGLPATLRDQTVRQTVRASVGGSRVRIVLSNEYGAQALQIGAAQIAPAEGTGNALTFGGQQSVTVPASAVVMSDPVEMPVAPLSRLSVSLYFPQTTPITTIHWDGLQPAQIAAGNAVNATALKADSTVNSRLFLSAVLMEAERGTRTVVAFGDSITDGAASTPGTDQRWPDFLARRLAGHNVAVINAGISGGRVLKNHMGPNALARFERDVLNQPGIRSVVLLMGINDISWPGSTFEPQEPATQADALMAGYRQLITRAKSRGVRIVGATLTPFEGALTMPGSPIANYHSPAKDAVRQRINSWIRSSGEFDAVLDFDAVVRDPQNPLRILPAYDSGDHLHLGDAGNKAVAESIDLKLLLGER